MAEGFTCAVVRKEYRSACAGGQYRDTAYCVLHYPGEEKNKEDFLKVKKSKLDRQDYDFRGTVFPDGTSDFQGFEFEANVSFEGVKFSGQRTDFINAQFSGQRTDFNAAQFSTASTSFSGAEFSAADTSFSDADGVGNPLAQVAFSKEVNFRNVTFRERATFWGSTAYSIFDSRAWAQFHGSRIEKPELLTFNTVLLQPGWFVNADVRKVDFTDVKWYGMPGGPEGTIDEEIAALKKREIESRHFLLAQVCRRLSANAEENREYPLANEFYYWSLDALRKEGWRSLGLIRTLYWLLSGYGVRAGRAFWVLVGLCAAFAALYMGFGPPKLQDLGQAVVYSLGAVARLNPEPRPTGPGLFQLLVIVEGILGPLQIALLALAIRRKVMR